MAAIVVLLGSGTCAAAENAPTPIVTDRPAVTASSIVVPSGTLQFENGFAETMSGGQRTFDVPETWLRFGMASKTELRLMAPNYFGQVGNTSGFGDLGIGVKQQLGPARGFDVSLILSLSLPSGATTFSSHGYDPSVQLPWSRTLSPRWTAAGMISVYWPTQDGRRNVTGQTAFLMDRQLTKLSDAFAEYAGDFSGKAPKHLLHFGAAYRPWLRHQFDFHIGVGLSSAAVDHFIGLGYSFRLQAVRH
jgi:hypothetical protein